VAHPFDPVLVAYDGSPYSEAAAAHARLLTAGGARSVLAYALPPAAFSFELEGAAYKAAVQEATAVLAGEARRFATPVEPRLLDGEPAPALVAEAEKLEAALLIMGTRGRSAATGILLGSTARYLLRASPRPLMVVHRSAPAIRHVIAGVDEGEASRRVVEIARRVADTTGADLTLVTVIDADRDLVANPPAYGIPRASFAEMADGHAARVFAPLRGLAGNADELTLFGNPADALREAAKDRAADVVVVGRKGGSGRDVDAWTSVAFSLAIKGPFATVVA
jgi:nucleotide-binding universal stress UspA family protein